MGELGGVATLGAHSAALDSWAGLALNPVAGKVAIGTADFSSGNLLIVNGSVGATAFNSTSDRNAKQNFAPVDPESMLAKVSALPITTWRFKQDTNILHIGPMAQDFHSAFGVGPDDRHIATVDADGVALAAIQGLNQKLHTESAEIQELKARISTLEKIILRLDSHKGEQ